MLSTRTRLVCLSKLRLPNQSAIRQYAATKPPGLTEGEAKLFDILNDKLDPGSLVVQDVSGGCGEFYHLSVSSKAFKGLSTIKQHRLVQELLKEEIKTFHGIQLKTSADD